MTVSPMRAVELFAGAGGLGMGVSNAGFRHTAVVEWNADACATLRDNRERGIEPVADWPAIYEGDVRAFDFSTVGEVDLVAGGPPCQPFSLGGKHGAHRDLRPRAFLFENVRGLTRPAFEAYFKHVILQLTYPELERREFEDWTEHRARLLKVGKRSGGLRYRVQFKVLNACDYGVPQQRYRVFVVGFRSDLNVDWTFPRATHSRAAMLWSQRREGAYWDRHGISKRARSALLPPETGAPELPLAEPWLTVRDALAGLPEPVEAESPGILNHRLQAGARSYAGHTGSALDEPAKTLKAGAHGVPGGENMLRYPEGRVRYFTVRESARLQTFSDAYKFQGAWGEAMRQVGNAVPVRLGSVVAAAVRDALTS
jgi:DNA (cytosine-5)-methyltransferase 1